MPERFQDAIIKYLSSHEYQPLKPRQLARVMGVAEQDYGSFREAIKMLRDSGRIVLGAKDALMLPEIADRLVGVYRANPRGFGFVLPESPNSHGDLFIPEGESGGAMSGDTVLARVFKRGIRGGETIYHGRIIEIVRRRTSQIVGTLEQAEQSWFLVPDGKAFTAPVLISDVPPGAKPGQKVVADILEYPVPGKLARGVIIENLGAAGAIEAETQSVIRANGYKLAFEDAAIQEAHAAMEAFDAADAGSRQDLGDLTIITIDPPDARDFDDAISVRRERDGYTLGVHIADVSHFVREGGALDAEARRRSTSVYFPRRVVPMLPEVLSNGVCSLQQGQRRFCKSVFIRYDQAGNVTGTRLAETVIKSARRCTYLDAQAVLDGKTGGFEHKVVQLLRDMQELARRIQKRRDAAGMIHLDIPKVEIVLDEAGKVVDAMPEDDSYTHTIIEMFMVEANEAVAAALDRRKVPFIRRIHPAPDPASSSQMVNFVKVCGHKLPKDMSRHDIQRLLGEVKGRPESRAINLAVLKSFEQAEYSPMRVGHFALASENYCHFTSPIRRYPDLTVHRLFAQLVRHDKVAPPELAELVRLADHCSTNERQAEAAERELLAVLMLQLLATKVGQEFGGVVTGVANFGIFVELPKYGIEGLIRMEDLGDDWWEVSPRNGEVRGERSGRKFRIGDPLAIRIASVSIPSRRLNLVPAGDGKKRQKTAASGSAVASGGAADHLLRSPLARGKGPKTTVATPPPKPSSKGRKRRPRSRKRKP